MTNIAFETLKNSAADGVEAVKASLTKNGDKMIDRKSQTDNVKSAIADLKAQKNTLDDNKKRAIIEASRQVLQEQIDMIATEQTKKAKEELGALAQELESINAVKKSVLEEERNLATVPGAFINEAREVVNDVKKMDGDALKSAGLYVGIPLAVGYLFKKLFGPGDAENKPGIVRRFVSWVAGIGAALGTFIGLRRAAQAIDEVKQQATDAVNLPEKAGRSAIDTINGFLPSSMKIPGGNATVENPKSDEKNEDPNETPQAKLERLVQEGKYVQAFLHAAKNGGGLSMENGQAFLQIDGGTPIEVTPEGVKQIQTYGESASGSLWMLYFESGAGYLVFRSVANRILYGKQLIPPTKWGKLVSIGKVTVGPLIAAKDVGKHILTYRFSPSGGEQLKASFVTQSLPARTLRRFTNWRRQKFFQIDIRTEKGLKKTIKRHKMMKNVVDVLKLGIGDVDAEGKPVKNGDLDLAQQELSTLTERVRAGMTVMDGKIRSGETLNDSKLAELVSKKDSVDFEQRLDEYEKASEEIEIESDENVDVEEDISQPSNADRSDLEQQLAKKNLELGAAKQKAAEAAAHAEQERAKLEGSQQNAERLRNLLEEQSRTEAVLKQNVSRLETELETTKQAGESKASEAKKIQGELDEKKSSLTKLEEEHETQRAKLQSDLNRLQLQVSDLQQSVANANAENQKMQSTVTETQKENDALRARMAEMQEQAKADASSPKTSADIEPNRGKGPQGNAGGEQSSVATPRPRPSGQNPGIAATRTLERSTGAASEQKFKGADLKSSGGNNEPDLRRSGGQGDTAPIKGKR